MSAGDREQYQLWLGQMPALAVAQAGSFRRWFAAARRQEWQQLRAHWRAYNDTGREGSNHLGSFKLFEKRDPPSEPFPESLRALVPAATAASTA